ncbi:MAG: 6-phosphofructokinase, partial [Anaerolineales bacterium]
YRVAKYAQENMGVPIRVAHAPKTIDNDLPLPSEIRTFGYETARDLGSQIVINIMEDALTGQRWYFVVAMGRKAGHLAMGIGKSSGATVTLIPEEWRNRKVRLQEVVDILVTSILRRKAEGKEHGVAVLAEGLVEYMDASDLEVLADAERDEHGHIRLSEINFGEIIKNTVRAELLKMGTDMRIVNKDLGYELRCATPNAFDIDYTRSLGQAAVDYLLNGGSNATITIQKDQVVAIPFDEMMDPNTGRTEVRMVNVDSFTFQSAYKFMIRLRKEHADDDMLIARMASFTNLSAEQFMTRYGYLMEAAPRPF